MMTKAQTTIYPIHAIRARTVSHGSSNRCGMHAVLIGGRKGPFDVFNVILLGMLGALAAFPLIMKFMQTLDLKTICTAPAADSCCADPINSTLRMVD